MQNTQQVLNKKQQVSPSVYSLFPGRGTGGEWESLRMGVPLPLTFSFQATHGVFRSLQL